MTCSPAGPRSRRPPRRPPPRHAHPGLNPTERAQRVRPTAPDDRRHLHLASPGPAPAGGLPGARSLVGRPPVAPRQAALLPMGRRGRRAPETDHGKLAVTEQGRAALRREPPALAALGPPHPAGGAALPRRRIRRQQAPVRGRRATQASGPAGPRPEIMPTHRRRAAVAGNGHRRSPRLDPPATTTPRRSASRPGRAQRGTAGLRARTGHSTPRSTRTPASTARSTWRAQSGAQKALRQPHPERPIGWSVGRRSGRRRASG